MSNFKELEMRESGPGDLAAIEALYPLAFPDEDLLPIVGDLLSEPAIALSLVAMADSTLAGHVIFTRCGITGQDEKSAMLGPLAVSPTLQKQGIGSKLVGKGFELLKGEGVNRVFVLGDPAYYSRFGFLPDARVLPPYPMPAEWKDAWQSLSLLDDDTPIHGKIALPKLWLQPSLWLP